MVGLYRKKSKPSWTELGKKKTKRRLKDTGKKENGSIVAGRGGVRCWKKKASQRKGQGERQRAGRGWVRIVCKPHVLNDGGQEDWDPLKRS